jgi:predicted RNase H-like nuclease (RuvC/YqgF family)
VDPNAPPRPNLLNHEKRLKEAVVTVEQLQFQNQELHRRIDSLESKLNNQTNYLSQLHSVVANTSASVAKIVRKFKILDQ